MMTSGDICRVRRVSFLFESMKLHLTQCHSVRCLEPALGIYFDRKPGASDRDCLTILNTEGVCELKEPLHGRILGSKAREPPALSCPPLHCSGLWCFVFDWCVWAHVLWEDSLNVFSCLFIWAGVHPVFIFPQEGCGRQVSGVTSQSDWILSFQNLCS